MNSNTTGDFPRMLILLLLESSSHDLILCICRHPNVEGRPIICEIVQQLQVPDYYVMRWSEEDMKMYSSEARTVGAPLESGHELYKDLQKIYLAKGETEKDN